MMIFFREKVFTFFGAGYSKGMLADMLYYIGNEYVDTVGQNLTNTKKE